MFVFIVAFLLVLAFAASKIRSRPNWSRGFVGAVGEKLDFHVTFVDSLTFHRYGRLRHRFRFKDSDGHCLVWWTDLEDAGLSKGQTARAKMTVQEHKRYRGTDETVIQRFRISSHQTHIKNQQPSKAKLARKAVHEIGTAAPSTN
jgi:hypothetical protein